MRDFRRVKVAWLTAQEQARKEFYDLQGLGQSLKVRQLQPVWCNANGSLIVGERRWRAAKLVGLDELDAIVTDENLSKLDIECWQAQENWLRSDLTNFERFAMCRRLMVEHGLSAKEISARLHVDQSTMTRILAPMRLIPAALEAFQAGILNVISAYAVSKAADEAEQHELLREALDGCNRDQLERTVRRKRSSAPSVKVGRLTVWLPSGYSVTVAGEAVGYDEFIEAISLAGKEARRAQSSGVSERTWSKSMSEVAKGRA